MDAFNRFNPMPEMSREMKLENQRKLILAQNERFLKTYNDTKDPMEKAELRKQLEIYNGLLEDIGAGAFRIKFGD